MATALVTGASSGIGKDVAKRLLEEGHTVYVAARRVEKMKDLEQLGATALKMDITNEEEVVAAVERTGGIDILVNNAGFGMYGAAEDTPIEDARYQFEVNIFGLARVTQLALPHMREKKAGKIINISSVGGKTHSPMCSWYHATKHALEAWSDCLRIEVAPFGIDVVIIQPGAIQTEFGDVMSGTAMERSSNGAYAAMTQAFATAIQREFDSGKASPPSVISDVIVEAIRSDRPKTRYARGKYAWTMLTMRRWLSDRSFDKVISRFIG